METRPFRSVFGKSKQIRILINVESMLFLLVPSFTPIVYYIRTVNDIITLLFLRIILFKCNFFNFLLLFFFFFSCIILILQISNWETLISDLERFWIKKKKKKEALIISKFNKFLFFFETRFIFVKCKNARCKITNGYIKYTSVSLKKSIF